MKIMVLGDTLVIDEDKYLVTGFTKAEVKLESNRGNKQSLSHKEFDEKLKKGQLKVVSRGGVGA